jgi:hypothetical protein
MARISSPAASLRPADRHYSWAWTRRPVRWRRDSPRRETARSLDHLIVHYSSGGALFRIGVDVEERRPLMKALHDGRPYQVPQGASLSLRNLAERSDDVRHLLRERLPDDTLPRFVDWFLDRVVTRRSRRTARGSRGRR